MPRQTDAAMIAEAKRFWPKARLDEFTYHVVMNGHAVLATPKDFTKPAYLWDMLWGWTRNYRDDLREQR